METLAPPAAGRADRSPRQAGFTLLETAVCTAIVALLATVVLLVSASDGRDLASGRRQVLARIAEARALAAGSSGATLVFVTADGRTRSALAAGSSWTSVPATDLEARVSVSFEAGEHLGLYVAASGAASLVDGVTADDGTVSAQGSVRPCDPASGIVLRVATSRSRQTITLPCGGGAPLVAPPAAGS